MAVLSRSNPLQTQPVWDLLHNPQLSDSGLHSKPTTSMTSKLRKPQEMHRGRSNSGKPQAKIRLMGTLLRHWRNSLQELCSHEVFLTKLNWELVEAIQDMEESSALKAHAMLQQQDLLATIIDILEWSNQKKLQQLTRELKEWEEKEESKIKCENPGGELPIPSLAPGRSAAHPPCTCLLETSSPIISLLRQMGRRDCSPILQMGKLRLKKVKVARRRAGSGEPESSPSFLRFLPRSLWESVAGPGPRSSIMLSLWFLSREQTGSPLRDGVVCQRASDPGTPPPTEGSRTDFLFLVILWAPCLGSKCVRRPRSREGQSWRGSHSKSAGTSLAMLP
ncbi:uncharacterized protein C20orf96 homolog isoform X1 [Hyaena hyaena]|uniref:uncharacterized protein C20orf96 homolog isoform X1 n=1 Tax=Hyaena hyaena TaxID=95912 RepID=UPI001924C52C|nr:uncharacterized protein C20orf96 homolog isoform X1 [Hyaena hyaena]